MAAQSPLSWRPSRSSQCRRSDDADGEAVFYFTYDVGGAPIVVSGLLRAWADPLGARRLQDRSRVSRCSRCRVGLLEGLYSRPRIRDRFRRRSFPRHAGPLSIAHERVRVPNLRLLATPTTRGPLTRPMLCRTACAGSFLRSVFSMLQSAVLPRPIHHRRSWADSCAAGERTDRLLRCTLGAIRHRSFLRSERAGPRAALCNV